MPAGRGGPPVEIPGIFSVFPYERGFLEVVVSGDVVARAKSALVGVTDGPWEVDEGDPGVWSPDVIVFGNYTAHDDFDSRMWEDGTQADLRFIAASRDLVPELVAAVERVRALHWPSETRDPACDCFDGLTVCPTIAALDGEVGR